MSASAPRRDEVTRPILLFLALVAYISEHQPTMVEMMTRFATSRATLKRRIALARVCGVVIDCRRERTTHHYIITDYGPFSQRGLSRAVVIAALHNDYALD